LRLNIILLYFLAILFLALGTIGVSLGALLLPYELVKMLQSITFCFSWVGIYFLYSAMKFSKVNPYTYSTILTSGLLGAIITLYATNLIIADVNIYDIIWDERTQTWLFQFHPILMIPISLIMVFVIKELFSVSKILYIRSRNLKVKRNLRMFFMGWIVVGLASVPFVLSVITTAIPSYTFLIFFAAGFFLISLSILRFPSSLIASTMKIYAIALIDNASGILFYHYDYFKGSEIDDPLLFSGIMVAIDSSMKHSIRGCRYLKIIDAGPRKILIERGFKTQAIMIVEQGSPLLQKILKRLLLLFELQFYYHLYRTDGDITPFIKFKPIIEKYTAFAM